MEEATWDTIEAELIAVNEKVYYDRLLKEVENELFFMVVLYVVIEDYNDKCDAALRIDTAKVDGNRIYRFFCEAAGEEQDCWT